MPDKSGYDVAVGPCRAYLQFLGLWPDPKKSENIFDILRFLIATFTMILFANIPQTVMMMKVWGDLNAVIEILTTANMPIFVALMKFLVAWYNRKVLKDLLKLMVEDWNRKYSDQDSVTIWKIAKFSRKISIVSIGSAMAVISAQFFMVLVFDVKHAVGSERAPYMTSYFPYDIQKSPNFEITWLGQCFSNIFAASAFSSIDGFFAVLVLHVCGQLTILRRYLKEIINDFQAKFDAIEFNEKFKNIVEQHERLNRCAELIEDSFNLMFLAQMVASSLALCLQGYQLVTILSNSEDGLSFLQLIHMINFVGCFAFSLFVYCYVAEELQYQSMGIDYAAYNSDWYNLPPKKTKLLFLLIHRSRKPLKITAGKFCAFSLRLYCSILKTSGGYLSMLLAVRDRLVVDE